jgi:hypothetical protein
LPASPPQVEEPQPWMSGFSLSSLSQTFHLI